MTAKLEVFYDYVSLYSYLGDSQLDSFEGVDVVYKPMLLGAVLKATGNRPPAAVQAKGRYMHKDMHRWAKRYAVPLHMNPKFPQNTVQALRLALVALDKGNFADINQRLFDAMWVEQSDLEDPKVLQSIVAASGVDEEDYLAAVGHQATKDKLRANTDEAINRGVFGAPTMFVGEEMYFGNDRLDFVREALANQ